jgi:hypothetical protein
VCVMGRHVPWERLVDRLRGRPARPRHTAGAVPVSLGAHTVWTRYYTPRELFARFAADFTLDRYRGLGLLVPPPHLAGKRPLWRPVGALLGLLEDRLGGLPGLRNAGDHFLMTMTRKGGR